MTTPSPSVTVRVDVTNPGQFFACCGLLEVAHRLWPGAEGWFAPSCFHLSFRTAVPSDWVDPLISALSGPARLATAGGDPQTAPIQLGAPLNLVLDWWLDLDRSPTRFKTWAANATSLQMYHKWLRPLNQVANEIKNDPPGLLEVCSRIQGSYGFDCSLGWNALDMGFSLNKHPKLKLMPLRPAVEILGAIGLQRFLPKYDRARDEIEYHTWRTPLPPVVAGPVATGVVDDSSSVGFRGGFVKRGSFKGLSRARHIGG